jgi:hypothetical protein
MRLGDLLQHLPAFRTRTVTPWLLEHDDRLDVVKESCAIRSVPRKTHMDTTTLLVIILLILLLGGGGWYGRGRWY